MSKINFFNEDIDFILENSTLISEWITEVISDNSFKINQLNYIICSDNYLLEINRSYLSHDYLTDIITFDNSDEANTIEADIFISLDRVRDNAKLLGSETDAEFHRVLIHGVLHLIGLDDKTEEDKAEMREKEEACLSLLRI
jgi:probable rRNA maturation factor